MASKTEQFLGLFEDLEKGLGKLFAEYSEEEKQCKNLEDMKKLNEEKQKAVDEIEARLIRWSNVKEVLRTIGKEKKPSIEEVPTQPVCDDDLVDILIAVYEKETKFENKAKKATKSRSRRARVRSSKLSLLPKIQRGNSSKRLTRGEQHRRTGEALPQLEYWFNCILCNKEWYSELAMKDHYAESHALYLGSAPLPKNEQEAIDAIGNNNFQTGKFGSRVVVIRLTY